MMRIEYSSGTGLSLSPGMGSAPPEPQRREGKTWLPEGNTGAAPFCPSAAHLAGAS